MSTLSNYAQARVSFAANLLATRGKREYNFVYSATSDGELIIRAQQKIFLKGEKTKWREVKEPIVVDRNGAIISGDEGLVALLLDKVCDVKLREGFIKAAASKRICY